MTLPRFFAIASDCGEKKYLRCIKEDVPELHGFLKLSGEEVLSPLTKYEMKMAECGNGLVHIRCCYNNKYWQRSSHKHSWIVAGANEPEEDQSKWSCTLFEPILAYEVPLSFYFRHVQLKRYLSLYSQEVPMYNSCIDAKSDDKETHDIFKIIDWETLLVLPKHVAFKGENQLYLKAYYESQPYLQFSVSGIGQPFVGDEIFPNSDGSIRIKNNHFGKFWRCNDQHWITADADESSISDANTLFWPSKVDNNVIALRNQGNKMFCKRFTSNGNTSCLSAVDPSISRFAHMEVEELVLSRNIYNVNYHLMDYRIYDQAIVTVANAEIMNTTRETEQLEVKFNYIDVLNMSWRSIISLKLGNKSNIRASVPKIANGNAEIAGSFSSEFYWGNTEERKNTVEVVYHASVPPMTKMKVKLTATKASCDIPFSYTQSDILCDGKPAIYDMDDGIYTCSNYFNFNYETSEEEMMVHRVVVRAMIPH